MPGQVPHRLRSLDFLILLVWTIVGGRGRGFAVLEKGGGFAGRAGAAYEAGHNFVVTAPCLGRAVEGRSVQCGVLALLERVRGVPVRRGRREGHLGRGCVLRIRALK
jgi:hypothetical protein